MISRKTAIEALAARQFDLLVVGGGLSGAGVALDAAARGLTVGLVERHDFASGSSGGSGKRPEGVDDVRLVLAVLGAADRYGAVAGNRLEATGVVEQGGRAVGAEVLDAECGGRFTVAADRVVDATGVLTGRPAPDARVDRQAI